MRTKNLLLTCIVIGLLGCTNVQKKTDLKDNSSDHVVKIEMNLSAFGVESDDFPSIDVVIDFSKDTSSCFKSYYNPAYENSSYSLSKSELNSILELLKINDLEKLKKEYKVNKTDQPSSKTTIYTTEKTFVIEDYGLEGDYPLKELYKIVYRY